MWFSYEKNIQLESKIICLILLISHRTASFVYPAIPRSHISCLHWIDTQRRNGYLCLRESSFLAFSSWRWWYLSLSLTNSWPQLWHRKTAPWCLLFTWSTNSLYSWNFSWHSPHSCFLRLKEKCPSFIFIINIQGPEYKSNVESWLESPDVM